MIDLDCCIDLYNGCIMKITNERNNQKAQFFLKIGIINCFILIFVLQFKIDLILIMFSTHFYSFFNLSLIF